jgi:hypothetical protein
MTRSSAYVTKCNHPCRFSHDDDDDDDDDDALIDCTKSSLRIILKSRGVRFIDEECTERARRCIPFRG